MSGSLRWWVIPGAMFVMTGVLLLGDADRKASKQERARSQPVATSGVEEASSGGAPAIVMVRDASGQRRLMAFDTTESRALILEFPPHFGGKRIDLTLWRRQGERRGAKPWLQLRPRVRPDGTLPMAGIVPGRYDIEAGLVDAPTIVLENRAAPGRVSFAAASPGR